MRLYLDPVTAVVIGLLVVGGGAAVYLTPWLDEHTGTTLEERCAAREARLATYDATLADESIDEETRALVEAAKRTVEAEITAWCAGL